jgi:Domain of unknown function (DUF4403)
MLLAFALLGILSCSKKLSPEKPSLSGSVSQLDSLPLSEIDIPVKIPLRSLQSIAEKEVDLVYTSPGWPNDYVVDNCDTRYMYRFRRGPLSMRAEGNQFHMSFTGYYQLAGSQRICSGTGSNRSPVTPWSPACTCGVGAEGERKVNVAFTARVSLRRDFGVDAAIQRLEPVPLDKCTVCFWSQDITGTVMERLRVQLDEARQAMLDSLGAISLRPAFQEYWNILNTAYPVYGYGYLQINPERIRLSRIITYKDTIFLTAGISARPVVSQVRPTERMTLLPEISDFIPRSGFNLYADAMLNYDSLSSIMRTALSQKRIDLDQGGRHIIVEKCEIFGGDREKLVLKVDFSGSSTGTFYLTGKPVYRPEQKQLAIEQLEFDIKSRDLIVRTVSWMFNRKILQTLQHYTRFDLNTYEQDMLKRINTQLNREPYPGVSMTGTVRELQLEKIYTFREMLVVRFHSTGRIELQVNRLSL